MGGINPFIPPLSTPLSTNEIKIADFQRVYKNSNTEGL